MALVTGIKNINEIIEKSSSKGTKLKRLGQSVADGQTVSIRFVNEINPDSPNYDEARGLAGVTVLHRNPAKEEWKRSAECTKQSEGRCFACELNDRNPKAGWYGKKRFFINVLINDGVEEPYVAVWDMGIFRSPIFETIKDYDNDEGSITNLTWKLKRNGTGIETTWILQPQKVDADKFDWSGIEIPSLDSYIKSVPYSEQESFYLGFDNAAVSTSVDW